MPRHLAPVLIHIKRPTYTMLPAATKAGLLKKR